MTNISSGESWFAACPKGLEGLLATELQGLGATGTRETVSGCYFDGPRAVAYRACLWSRLANRVFLPLARTEVDTAQALYDAIRQLPWHDILRPGATLAVDFSGQNSDIRNTRFGAQRCKDGIVDHFVDRGASRPNVDLKNPEVRVNVRLSRGVANIALDLSGESLHKRGYRLASGAAPLKENLAAALLLRAGWPALAAEGGALIDPMCGSATLLLEGALMAADQAPGLRRLRYGFEAWVDHDPGQWRALLSDARGRSERGLAAELPEIRGYDADPRVIRRAEENIARAGLERVVRVSCKALAELRKPTHRPINQGLVICNPPYGERLGEKQSLTYLYAELGQVLHREFGGFQAAIFTADKDLGRATGLRSHKRYALYNGAIAASLLLFDLTAQRPPKDIAAPVVAKPLDAAGAQEGGHALSAGAQMFANRLRKNRKRLARWVKRENINCYRLYDADMPEYAVAVDIYGSQIHVAEYKAPAGIEEAAARRRMQEVIEAVPEALDVAPAAVAYKERSRQRGRDQYGRSDNRGELLSVSEGRAKLLVNLHDYLDTGLFLDHRPLRLRLSAEAAGKDFLNLFCYTGAATIHAALGGARSTTSVDMSNTYLDWLRKNLAHNGLPEGKHALERADCRAWVRESARLFDLVLLDPPSFSNSSRMADTLDVQRDQVELLTDAMKILKPGGVLYFSNNRRGFKLDPRLQEEFNIEDITASTMDPDFQRNSRIHTAFSVRCR